MKTTQLDIVPKEEQAFESYNPETNFSDEKNRDEDEVYIINQEGIATNIKTENEEKENVNGLFETDFEFWNYMEPEQWKMSMITREQENEQEASNSQEEGTNQEQEGAEGAGEPNDPRAVLG